MSLDHPGVRMGLALLVTLAVAWLAFSRLHISYDLGVFLPQAEGQVEQVLAERLGQGPGTRSVFVELQASSPGDAMALAEQMRQLPGVSRVLPEQGELSIEQLPAYIWRNRLLLADLPDTGQEWAAVLAARADELSFLAGDEAARLIAADPAFTALAVAEGLGGPGLPRFDQGDTQYLLLGTAVSAFDPGAQQRLIDDLRRLVNDRGRLFGAPVYAVDLQQTVRFEATLYSALASFALLVLIVWRFRAVFPVLAVGVPLLAGFSAGMAVLSLLFDATHGITLAFGFTLLGVAIDYPLHLFTHRQVTGSADNRAVWRIMRVGIASTLVAYAAFFFAGSQGLQQLGVFAFSGILAAAAMAAWLGGAAMRTGTTQAQSLAERLSAPRGQLENDPREAPPPERSSAQPGVTRWLPAALVVGASAVALSQLALFNDDLSALTPVSEDTLADDARIRRSLDVVDMRYLVATQAQDLQTVLLRTESVTQALSQAFNQLAPDGAAQGLSGWQSIADLLPSERTQAQRQAALADEARRAAWQQGVQASALVADTFAPFEQAWDRSATSPLLRLQDLQAEQSLAELAQSLLIQREMETETEPAFTSLVWLYGLHDPQAVTAVLPDHAQLIDLKDTSTGMFVRYRQALLTVLAVALVCITALLVAVYSVPRALWLVLNMLAAVAAGALAAALMGGLSLFDIMALALVAGLGLDYLLFSSADGGAAPRRAMHQAVALCAVSSLLVFGVLSLSSIPVLRGIGSTVFVGVCVAFLLARLAKPAGEHIKGTRLFSW